MALKYLMVGAISGLSLAAVPVDAAGNGKDNGAKGFKGHNAHQSAGCPPGLAKKNPPCVPPGLAKQAYAPRYDVGERILRDYQIIRDRDRYGLRNDALYYLVGREVFRVSPETGQVLAFIGLADALLN